MNYIKIQIFIILSLTLFSSKSMIYCNELNDKKSDEVEVWLTVSSLAGHNKQTNNSFERQLELNWRNIPIDNHDQWIGLFTEEPMTEKIEKRGQKYSIELTLIGEQSSGSHRTSVQFPRQKFSKRNLTSTCLSYWIAYIRLNKVVVKNCIRNNPFWMEESLETIGDKSLLDLMIPGTHNSASFGTFELKDNNFLDKYTLCQDENVWNQLIYGIRFLDLRVSYENVRGDKYKLWIVHGPIRMKATLESIILEVKQFIKIATKEILIIDLHRFEKGFNRKESSRSTIRRRHQKVAALILRHLKEYLVPIKMGLSSTINELIAENKRIIVGYASDDNTNEYFFPQTKHLWPNTDSMNELEIYFNRTICKSYPNILYAAMVHLTADKIGIISDRYKGLRTMAQTVNQNISELFRSRWSQCANVVASDYFLGNNFIEIAIKSNLVKFKENSDSSKA